MNTSSNIQTKICGLTTEDAVAAVAGQHANYAGFVFFPPSPRHIEPARAKALASRLPQHIQTVAVVVDPSDEQLDSILKEFRPHYWQLHGKETPARVAEIAQRTGIPVIKAISVRSGDDIAKAGQYTASAAMLMFDAKVDDRLPGGNGMAFDWMLLKNKEFALPWFLSGGLNSQNIGEALAMSGARMVDVSSSLENRPGVKDPALIKEFMDAVSKR